MDYETLITQHQEGKIDDLHFLLEQEELAQIYLEEIKKRKEQPNNQNARKWIRDYENRNLYENVMI